MKGIFLIGGKLLYNFMLVSAIQQLESVIYIYIYIYTHPLRLEPPSPLPSLQKSSQSARLGSLCCYFLSWAYLHLPLLCPQLCSLLGSSVPFFWIPYICVNIWYLLFSFWLTSLYIRGSRFIQLNTTDSNSFLFHGWDIRTTISLSIHLSMDKGG